MASLVAGRRVNIRYRLPTGEQTDVIGHEIDPADLAGRGAQRDSR